MYVMCLVYVFMQVCSMHVCAYMYIPPRLRNSRTTNINFFTPPDRRLPNYYLNSMIPKLTMAWNRELSIDQQSIRSLQAFKLRVNSEANLHHI